jgi:hypothetical protein
LKYVDIFSEYLTDIWDILGPFGTFYSGFGIMYQEKSVNPVHDRFHIPASRTASARPRPRRRR